MDYSKRDLDPEQMVRNLPELVPAKQAAEFLGMSDLTLHLCRKRGRIRALKTAKGKTGRVMYPKTEIARLLAEMIGLGDVRGDS